MSKEIFSKQTDIRLLYHRYKDTAYYTIFIVSLISLVCIILLFKLVIPQVQNWFSIRGEVVATRERIDTINQNIAFMNNLDKERIDKQVSVATSALPFEKDFGGILNALTDASLKAGVVLDDYSFQVGSIASVSGKQNGLVKGFSSVQLTITIIGNADGVGNFLKEINTRLPLSEATAVSGEFGITNIRLQFYQKPFPQLVIKDEQPLAPFSANQTARLDEFEEWQSKISPQEPQIVSSTSAVPLF